MMEETRLFEGFQGFMQKKSQLPKMQEERMRVFSVWWLSKLGLESENESLNTICLASLNPMVSWFCV